jgi:hypothetical protein
MYFRNTRPVHPVHLNWNIRQLHTGTVHPASTVDSLPGQTSKAADTVIHSIGVPGMNTRERIHNVRN